tara:strand:+ start:34 stop:768 length:735 start_codon:yes stop_codon:yes gene_type:complete
MPDSKVVYVNENSDSDDEIIYGEKILKVENDNEPKPTQEKAAVVPETAVDVEETTNEEVKVENVTMPDTQTEVVGSDIDGTSSNPIDLTGGSDENEPIDEEPPVDEEPVDEEPVVEDNDGKVDEEPADEEPADKEPADEEPVVEELIDQNSADPESISVGEDQMSGGYASSIEEDNESLDTQAILNIDPLYFRLTKFLQTRGGGPENDEPENVAEILKKININLDKMNSNLTKFFELGEKKTSE